MAIDVFLVPTPAGEDKAGAGFRIGATENLGVEEFTDTKAGFGGLRILFVVKVIPKDHTSMFAGDGFGCETSDEIGSVGVALEMAGDEETTLG